MIRFVNYSSHLQHFRGLPQWARTIVAIFATPGVILLGLSILAVLVSLLALLLLTLPVYSLLRLATARREVGEANAGVRRVEATVIES